MSLHLHHHGMESGPTRRALGREDRRASGGDGPSATRPPARIRVPSSEAYAEVSSESSEGRHGQGASAGRKRGALRRRARYELWFEHEADFHLHPHLTRMSMRRGKQVEVPSPGQYQKDASYGGVNYATGERLDHKPDVPKGAKNSAQFLIWFTQLLTRAKRRTKRIVLALDNGSIHTGKVMAMPADPAVKRFVQIVWLPKDARDLNEEERIWKFAKEHGIANVLFRGRDTLRAQVPRLLQAINRDPKARRMIVLAYRVRADYIPRT